MDMKKNTLITGQNLFEAIINVTGFTPLESDMQEILWAVERDQPKQSAVSLDEANIAELAQIGSQHLYLGDMDEGKISYGGILEIIKRYEQFRENQIAKP